MTKKVKPLKINPSKKNLSVDKDLLSSVKKQEKVIRAIIKKHGPIINLEENPQIFLDILHHLKSDLYSPDGGLPPGGVPNPPGPSSVGHGIDNVLLMKEILKLNKKISKIEKMMK